MGAWRGGRRWTPSPGREFVLLACAAMFVVLLGIAAWRGRAAGSASGRPLPVTRRAAGWEYGAEHRVGEGLRLHWVLTYRGEVPPSRDRLITPLGMLTNEPSRIGETGPILDVSRNARKIPESGHSVSLEILTRGFYPSDCMTKPRGMPPDWSCRPDGDEPGWIAPSILFGERFRVEDATP